MDHKFQQVVLTDGDLTIIVQNTYKLEPSGEFAPVWHVLMVSPHFESGIYRKEVVESKEAGIDMAFDQFYEEFGREYSREQLEERINRIDN